MSFLLRVEPPRDAAWGAVRSSVGEDLLRRCGIGWWWSLSRDGDRSWLILKATNEANEVKRHKHDKII
jgi:hypothetical protein